MGRMRGWHFVGGTGVSPVQAQAKRPWPFGVTPKNEIHCRGGALTAPTSGLSREKIAV